MLSKKMVIAAVLTASLSACGTTATSSRPVPPGITNAAYCQEHLEEMQRRSAGINRRTAAAEAAYIATRNEKIAKANAEDLQREEAQLAAEIERDKQLCNMR
jgi:hypothetical protein